MWDAGRIILNNSVISPQQRLYLSVGKFKTFNRLLYDFVESSAISLVALFCTCSNLSTSLFLFVSTVRVRVRIRVSLVLLVCASTLNNNVAPSADSVSRLCGWEYRYKIEYRNHRAKI